ncbi:MAG: HAD family hydrolase [Candidatus Parabeggiatoa sp.]|nr:HAD family hydrolase [Candidatus Parabeggiatoa sp.]
MVAVDKHLAAAIELLPTVRPEAKAIISRLKQRQNIKATYIISGDHDIPTKKLAKALGIDHYFAETLPEDKAGIIEQLQQEGHFICYISDGIAVPDCIRYNFRGSDGSHFWHRQG